MTSARLGNALMAVATSTTILLCVLALGAVDAADSDLLLSSTLSTPNQHQRSLLSFDYTAGVNRDSESSLRAIATEDTTAATTTAAAATGATCSKCQWQ